MDEELENYLIEKKYKPLRGLDSGQFQIMVYENILNGIKYAAKHQPENENAKIEAEILKQANSEGIVKYIDEYTYTNRKETQLCIIMELADMNLSCYIHEHGPIENPAVFRAIAYQLIEAIDYLHALGFIHRDLSIRNVLVKGNRFMLTDFGLSRKIGGNYVGSVGSPSTKAPEVIMGMTHDEKMDIWSLGCILVFVAVAEEPFAGSSDMDVLINIGRTMGFSQEINFLVKKFIGKERSFPERTPFPELAIWLGWANYELITTCLIPDAEKRPAAAELLKQKCFKLEINFNEIPTGIKPRPGFSFFMEGNSGQGRLQWLKSTFIPYYT